MSLSLTQTATVRIVAGQAITNNLLRLLALSPSVSISGSVGTADLAAGAVTAAKATPGAYWFGTTAGGTTAYTLTLNPALGALANGVKVVFKMNATNTAASTLAVDGLAAKKLLRAGAGLRPGDLMINGVYEAVYNSSSDGGAGAWELSSRLASPDFRHETLGGSSNAYTWTSTNSPAIQSLPAILGQVLTVKPGFTNTGACTLAVDGLAAKAIIYPDQTALAGGELRAGAMAQVCYDSVLDKFVLLSASGNPRPAVAAGCRNLEMRGTSTTQAALTADEVILKSTAGTGVARMFSGVSLTIDITGGVALNAFETGAIRTTNRWYYVWLISDGTNVRAVLEDSGSADGAVPAGPDLSNVAFTGYAWQGLVGQIRLNATGAGEIVAFWQRDRQVWFKDTNVFTGLTPGASYAVLAAGNLTNLRAAIPPTAISCSGTLGADNTSDAATIMACAVNQDGTLDSTPNEIGAFEFNINNVTAYNSFGAAAQFTLPVRGAAARNLQFKNDTAATLTFRMNLSGYTF